MEEFLWSLTDDVVLLLNIDCVESLKKFGLIILRRILSSEEISKDLNSIYSRSAIKKMSQTVLKIIGKKQNPSTTNPLKETSYKEPGSNSVRRFTQSPLQRQQNFVLISNNILSDNFSVFV